MSDSVLYPVQTLRQHLTGLDAAITTCLDDPGHKPVHKLRTETRRAEALLVLLGLVPDLPDHRKEAAAMLGALKKLRRSAGEVRDLDVHRKMLEGFAEAEGRVAEMQTAAPGKGRRTRLRQEPIKALGEATASEPPARDASPEGAKMLSEAASELKERLGHERDKAARHLTAVLKKRQAKTATAAQELLKVLDAAAEVSLPGPELLQDAETVLTSDGLLRSKKVGRLDEEELHTVRKSAKRARYLLESLPENAILAEAARRFEILQETGGQWHDALELARAARRHFGKAHELTVTYREERDRKLEEYRAALKAGAPAAKAHVRHNPAAEELLTTP